MPKPKRLDLINVFFYRYWDDGAGRVIQSRRAGTYDAIKRREGQPILESKQTVPRLLLDADGFLTDK